MKESYINQVYTYNYKEGKGIVKSIEYFQIINTEKKPINITKDRLEEYIDDLFSKKKDKRNIKQRKPKKEAKEKKNLIIFFTVILTIILTLIFIFLFSFKKKNIKENEKNYQEEKLIAKLNYIPNNLLKFRSEKIINLEVNTDDPVDNDYNMNKNNTKNMTQYTDFIFIIREKKDEKDDNNLIVKNIYTGYIGIINVTLNNGTNDMMVVYDEQLSKSIKNEKQNNLRNIDEKPNLNYVDEKNKLCFIKIEFYENGEIKNIFLPEDFEVSNMVYINEMIKLIIPKISPELYSSNIESKIYEIESKREK
jgi:hypothetical protein